MILLIFGYYALAESLFANDLYDLAQVEYQRIFFFDTTAHRNYQLRLHYTIVLLHQDFFTGYTEIDKVLEDFPESAIPTRMILAKTLINTGNYGRAIDLLKSNLTKDSLTKKLLGFAYLFDHQYYNAMSEFQEIEFQLALRIEKYLKTPKKSVTRAMLFSVMMPGLGEVYAGDIGSGLRDLLLNLSSGFLLYNAVKHKRYVDAGIIFSFLFNRFYFGAIANASRIADENNEKKKNEFLKEMREEYNRFSTTLD
ncbi:MAG: hypothetical protein ABIL40_08525 [candidate division WOR-3 bacterium]